MAMRLLRRLAAAAPACVFPAIGENGAGRVAALASLGRFRFVSTARHAPILLVAGKIRKEDHEDLCRLHDQLPHPRRTLWWGSDPIDGFADPLVVASIDEARDAILDVWRRLVSGEETSEPDLLPDKPAHPWRGKGEHGQGGEGMMGGKPYGRPMAMTGDDLRDGLALDQCTCEYGPLLPILPPD
ncbi:hypothetical protein [Roseibium salinum]|uniref:Uncharacterized protein n=1 Tax=Roseibium salinum TaxID=1604349 RepID=A0ABT3QXS4_9HYPH|nr:hypothetical protein [Roseibium sp. DSM 29163]MCX2721643.1 hypothetical protein [Roseibium sp. DSM 29163]